jgi:hypothetical protein
MLRTRLRYYTTNAECERNRYNLGETRKSRSQTRRLNSVLTPRSWLLSTGVFQRAHGVPPERVRIRIRFCRFGSQRPVKTHPTARRARQRAYPLRAAAPPPPMDDWLPNRIRNIARAQRNFSRLPVNSGDGRCHLKFVQNGFDTVTVDNEKRRVSIQSHGCKDFLRCSKSQI